MNFKHSFKSHMEWHYNVYVNAFFSFGEFQKRHSIETSSFLIFSKLDFIFFLIYFLFLNFISLSNRSTFHDRTFSHRHNHTLVRN